MKLFLQLCLIFVATTICLAGDQWQMGNPVELPAHFWFVLGCGVFVACYIAVTFYIYIKNPGIAEFPSI